MKADDVTIFHGLACEGAKVKSPTPNLIYASSNVKDFAGYWPRSDNMGGACGHVFQCADVLDVWLHTIGAARGTVPCFIVVKNEWGEPWLALALGIERRFGVRLLTFLDGGVNDYNAPLILSVRPSAISLGISDLVRQLCGVIPAFDVALFDKMPAEVLGRPNPLVEPNLRASSASAHVMSLRGTWEDYQLKRSRTACELKRNRAKLEKAGRTTFLR